MAKWRRVGSPFEYDAGGVNDVENGWSWTIERDGFEPRSVDVVVAETVVFVGGDLPEDSREAIATSGASAIDPFLDDEDPPASIVVSSHGVSPADPRA